MYLNRRFQRGNGHLIIFGGVMPTKVLTRFFKVASLEKLGAVRLIRAGTDLKLTTQAKVLPIVASCCESDF
jgi:hypothetical protein